MHGHDADHVVGRRQQLNLPGVHLAALCDELYIRYEAAYAAGGLALVGCGLVCHGAQVGYALRSARKCLRVGCDAALVHQLPDEIRQRYACTLAPPGGQFFKEFRGFCLQGIRGFAKLQLHSVRKSGEGLHSVVIRAAFSQFTPLYLYLSQILGHKTEAREVHHGYQRQILARVVDDAQQVQEHPYLRGVEIALVPFEEHRDAAVQQGLVVDLAAVLGGAQQYGHVAVAQRPVSVLGVY